MNIRRATHKHTNLRVNQESLHGIAISNVDVVDAKHVEIVCLQESSELGLHAWLLQQCRDELEDTAVGTFFPDLEGGTEAVADEFAFDFEDAVFTEDALVVRFELACCNVHIVERDLEDIVEGCKHFLNNCQTPASMQRCRQDLPRSSVRELAPPTDTDLR